MASMLDIISWWRLSWLCNFTAGRCSSLPCARKWNDKFEYGSCR